MSAFEPSAVSTRDVAEVGDVSPVETSARQESCDVCIVGAGVAGLNALFVASRYLSRDQKVILIDRRERVGGMWVDTYPYVRLHQPHPGFTAGNIKWTLGKDRSYLPTKGEVLDHFEHCLKVIRQRVQVDEYFGCEVESHDETNGIVRITCRSSDGQRLVVESQRLIKAYGFQVKPNDPLEISSERVTSVSPDFCDMRCDEMRESDTPVWIIGGGKTAMDTAHALITEYPGREVNLVAGSGTYFVNRDRTFPSGARRWWRGKSFSSFGLEMTRRFDGTNEADVADWFRAGFGALNPDAAGYALDIGKLYKGIIWLNGQCAGRYWQVPASEPAPGWQHGFITLSGAGQPTQRYYHLPKEWLREHNVLVLFEESSAAPEGVRLLERA